MIWPAKRCLLDCIIQSSLTFGSPRRCPIPSKYWQRRSPHQYSFHYSTTCPRMQSLNCLCSSVTSNAASLTSLFGDWPHTLNLDIIIRLSLRNIHSLRCFPLMPNDVFTGASPASFTVEVDRRSPSRGFRGSQDQHPWVPESGFRGRTGLMILTR